MLAQKKDRKKELETYYLEQARRASGIFSVGIYWSLAHVPSVAIWLYT
jgi:hypothetical protein